LQNNTFWNTGCPYFCVKVNVNGNTDNKWQKIYAHENAVEEIIQCFLNTLFCFISNTNRFC